MAPRLSGSGSQHWRRHSEAGREQTAQQQRAVEAVIDAQLATCRGLGFARPAFSLLPTVPTVPTVPTQPTPPTESILDHGTMDGPWPVLAPRRTGQPI